MGLLGLGLLGVVIGAVGCELLRATKPEFVQRIEESASRFAQRLGVSKSSEKKPGQTQKKQ